MNASHSPIDYGQAPLSPLHRRVFAGGALGQFTDGYILGGIGIALALGATELDLTAVDLGLVAAASLIGILVGSLLFGPLVDRIGRARLFLFSAVAFTLVSLAQLFVTDSLQLILVRLAIGIAIGADYAVGVTLVSEWMPKRHRPRTLGFMQCAWAAGYACAYIVGYFLRDFGPDAWRWVLVSSAVPAFLTLLVRIGVPESPVWLMMVDRTAEARDLVKGYLGSGVTIRDVPRQPGEEEGIASLFGRSLRRQTLVSCTFFTCQVIPYFAISIFLPQIYESFQVEDPYFYGMIFNLFLFMGILFGTWVVDRVSRRAFILTNFYLCAALLIALLAVSGGPVLYTIVALSLFSFTISAGAVLCYVYPPELFPSRVRGSGVGLTVACSRIGAASGTFFLPVLLEGYGTVAALGVCIASLLVGGVICHALAPETSSS